MLLVLFSCQKNEETSIKTYNLSGLAQKGPFLTGSEVTIIELNNQLNPTGKVFFSTIEDNTGYFAFPDVEFESKYIQLKVDGDYYNEVFGGVNNFSEIILQSIVDISNNSVINVNIITHLVQARTFVLVKSGLSFNEANEQAYDEFLALFFIENPEINRPENLDLTSSDADGGVLLLVSSIIQSNIGSGKNFSEFMTGLTNDFKDNGNIDIQIFQKALATSGFVLNIQEVRQNLISRYSSLGKSIDPHSGSQFLRNFNMNNTFPTIFDGIFPSDVGEYTNLIHKGDTVYIDKDQSYTIAINGFSETGIRNIWLSITSTSNNFTTDGVDWYIDGNKKTIVINNDINNLSIPIEFSGSGNLTIEMGMPTIFSGNLVKYPKTEVIWE